MEVDYYSKYLKYKSKYLELKEQIGGGSCTLCNCSSFKGKGLECNRNSCQHGRRFHN